jgi:hypothetical protein
MESAKMMESAIPESPSTKKSEKSKDLGPLETYAKNHPAGSIVQLLYEFISWDKCHANKEPTLTPSDSPLNEIYKFVFDYYERNLKENNAIDFSDMIDLVSLVLFYFDQFINCTKKKNLTSRKIDRFSRKL